MPVLRRILTNETIDIPLTGRTLYIGRLRDNDIVIDNAKIPDIAAEVQYAGNTFHLKPLHSGCVRHNGMKCKTTIPLHPGDRIEIGPEVFIYDHEKTPVRDVGVVAVSEKSDIIESLIRFAEVVGKERDLRKLLNIIIDNLLKIVGGSDAFIFKLDHEKKPQLFVSLDAHSTKDRFSDTIVQQVLKSGEGVFLENALVDPSFTNSQSIVDLQLTSVLCVPIKVAGKIIGIIYLGAKRNSHAFKKQDLEILNVYAAFAGSLIHHVEYISQQREIIQKINASQTCQHGIVAESKIMQNLLAGIENVSLSDIGILLEGETGTGKDLVAQCLHEKSKRKEKPFIVVNCSSIQKDLQESELFGFKKGSFTGALRDHRGLFSAADHGTIFLDEIGDMEIGLQAKFLRTLETGKIRPVGSTIEEDVDVRVICATNKNLKEMVDKKTFRQDLYYRINQCTFRLPPLRERDNDSISIAYHFLELFKAQYPEKQIIDFHPDTLKFIISYDWPGNIRELKSTVHRAVLSAADQFVTIDAATTDLKVMLHFGTATKQFQNELIKKALRITSNNKEEAAKLLGLSRSTFFRYLTSVKVE